MEGIDALNSWKPDLGHKTGNCGPKKPKRGQKFIGQWVYTYIPPPAFRNQLIFWVLWIEKLNDLINMEDLVGDGNHLDHDSNAGSRKYFSVNP